MNVSNSSTRLSLLALLVLVLALMVPVQAGPSSATIVGGKGVGSYQLGKKFELVSDALGAPTRVLQSDTSSDARLAYYKKYGMYFFIKKELVTGIQVENPMFSTPEGIHVGSSRSDVTRAYGDPQELRESDVVYPERGLGFKFRGVTVTHINVFDKEGRDLARGDRLIVPGVRVGGIKLGGSADFVLGQWKQPTKRSPSPDGAEMLSYENKGVIVVVAQNRVSGLWIFSPEFRTAQGLHVGSKRTDVVRAFGKAPRKEEVVESYPTRGIGFMYEDGVVKQIFVKSTQKR